MVEREEDPSSDDEPPAGSRTPPPSAALALLSSGIKNIDHGYMTTLMEETTHESGLAINVARYLLSLPGMPAEIKEAIFTATNCYPPHMMAMLPKATKRMTGTDANKGAYSAWIHSRHKRY